MWGRRVVAAVIVVLLGGAPLRAGSPTSRPPDQIVQAFLRTCYSGRPGSAWETAQEALQTYGVQMSEPPGGAAYMIAADRWSIRRTRVGGATAEVDTDFRVYYWQGCEWSERYYPARTIRLTFTLARRGQGWRLKRFHPLFPRADTLAYRDRPFYLVIAGCFRSRKAAERYYFRHQDALGDDVIPSIRRSDELATLRKGWYAVVPRDGECLSREEAEQVSRRLTDRGVPAYVRRIHQGLPRRQTSSMENGRLGYANDRGWLAYPEVTPAASIGRTLHQGRGSG
jgi:hypothetical protein